MARTKAKPVTVNVLPDDVWKELNSATPTGVALVSTPKQLIELVDAGQIANIPTNRLAPLYIVLDALNKRIVKLLEKIKDKDLKNSGLIQRRTEGQAAGDRGQHRVFSYPGLGELTIQEKRSWQPDPQKLQALLKEKKLWDTATNVIVTTSGDAFQKFLRKHRTELEQMGLELEYVVDMEKVDGLCKAKLITEEELESILNKPDPTYALLPRLEK